MVASNTGGSLAPQRPFNYRPWFDNARRLKDLVAKLEIAAVHSVEQAEKTHKGRNTAGSTPTGEHQASTNQHCTRRFRWPDVP